MGHREAQCSSNKIAPSPWSFLLSLLFFWGTNERSHNFGTSMAQKIKKQKIPHGPQDVLSLASGQVSRVHNNKRCDLVSYVVCLLQDVANHHHNGSTKKGPDIPKKWMGLGLLRLVLDLANDRGRIILDEDVTSHLLPY